MKRYSPILCSLLIALVAIVVTACSAPGLASQSPSQPVPEERTARLPQDVSTQTQPATATPPATGNPAGAQESADAAGATSVTILLTNDVHGKVDPCG